MPQPSSISNHLAFSAAAFEGTLVGVAVIAGWILDIPPTRTFHFDFHAAWIGVAAAAPLAAVFALCLVVPWRPLQTITKLLDETIVPLFRGCTLVQLGMLAAFAGLGEEMLFRGIIQASVAEEFGPTHGVAVGLIVAAVLFGLLHLVTPTYAIMAGAIGLYLGWLWLAVGNLLAPIVAHAVYDFIALTYLVKIKKPASEET
jgi:uncharacterized protein